MPNRKTSSLALKGKKYIFIVLTLMACGVIIWVMMSLFSTQKKSSVDTKVIELAKPLKPTLDVVALSKINDKTEFTKEELEKFPIRIFSYDTKTKTKSLQIIEPN